MTHTYKDEIYTKLAGKVNFPKSRFIRQVFALLVTPEEGEMLLSLPATVSEFAKNYKMSEAEAAEKLKIFARKGVVIPMEKRGELRYFCVNTIIQFHDATSHATIYNRYEPVQKEIIEIWRRFRESEWLEPIRDLDQAGTKIARVVPAWGSVKDTSQLLPYEDLKTIMEQAPGIAVTDCPCRWLSVQEHKCDKPFDVCLSLNPNAVKYLVDQETGKKISIDEGYKVCERAGDAGLVATIGGLSTKTPNLCFCCNDCCIALRPLVQYGLTVYEKSRYEATVDQNVCNGCQTCVERCPFNAIEMVKTPDSKIAKAVINPEKCFGCGVCVIKCPVEAMEMKTVRPVEFIHSVSRINEVNPI
jgi:ferredoxin